MVQRNRVGSKGSVHTEDSIFIEDSIESSESSGSIESSGSTKSSGSIESSGSAEPDDSVALDGSAYSDVRELLNSRDFILNVIMSELDILSFKSGKYKKLLLEIKKKRTALSERIRLQTEGLKTFPAIISHHATIDPAQMDDAYSILKEESTYAQLLNQISTRVQALVNDREGLRLLVPKRAFRSVDYKAFAMLLKPGVVARRQKELILAVEKLEIHLEGDARRTIREHLYGVLVAFARNPRTMVDSLRFNYMIMGPPGTGKSYLADEMASYFHIIGVFVRRDKSSVKKPDLVASYVGQSAAKTRRAVYAALESVLFMDEAYALLSCEYQPGTRSPREVTRRDQYGLEAVDEMVSFMTEYRSLICIIAAGYQEEMETCFLGTNQGLRRRFAHRWVLQRYSRSDVLRMFTKLLVRFDSVGGMMFKNARHVFEPGFSEQDAAENMRLLLFALDYLDALPNQAGDIEKLAEATYSVLSMVPHDQLVDDDYITLANNFLAETSDRMRIVDLHRSKGLIDVVGEDGTRIRLRV